MSYLAENLLFNFSKKGSSFLNSFFVTSRRDISTNGCFSNKESLNLKQEHQLLNSVASTNNIKLQQQSHESTVIAQQQHQLVRMKTSFKWLADKIYTDLKEVRLNFNYFKQNVQNNIPFAIIQLESEAVNTPEMIDKLGESLAFLHQLDMKIVLVLSEGETTARIDPDILKEIKKQNEHMMHNLVESFMKYNILTMPILNGSNLFKCESSSQNEFKGEIKSVNANLLNHCFATHRIPVLNSTSTNNLYLDPSHLVSSLALELKPFKIIKLNRSGGLRGMNEKIVLNINLSKDAGNNEINRIESQIKSLKNALNVNVTEIKDLLILMPSYTSYVLTNVNDMIAELFTNSGRGTFFKLSEPIRKSCNLKDLDIEKMSALIETSFGKKLKEDFFASLSTRNPVIFVNDSYTALAIVTRPFELEPAYLDKFCVAPQNQGHGLADLLWESLSCEFETLFWRSRVTNPINTWYFRRAHGSWKTDKWILFHFGLDDPSASKKMLDYVNNLEASFEQITEKALT